MIAENIKVGMRVVPIRSTHPSGTSMPELLTKRHSRFQDIFEKGYLIVCRILDETTDDNYPIIAVLCHKRGRAAARWKWEKFLPEDLEPANANSMWCLKEMILDARSKEGG